MNIAELQRIQQAAKIAGFHNLERTCEQMIRKRKRKGAV